MERRSWCEGFDLYRVYHDADWGVPLWENQALFELPIQEGAQAGLSWSTVLKKRESYRIAFDHFSPEKIARYDDAHLVTCHRHTGVKALSD
jgi:DNA-3-methyladenine glycosylase I